MARQRSLRQRLGQALLGPQVEEVGKLVDLIDKAYRFGPALLSPDELRSEVGEIDLHFTDALNRSMNWIELTAAPSEADRLRIVKESRQLYRLSVLNKYIISLWTSYGFGENVRITPLSTEAGPVWTEFWSSDRNREILSQHNFQDLSNKLLKDGELFLVFFVDKATGNVTIRTIPTEQITARLTNPSDEYTAVFYERTWLMADGVTPQTLYYPDWLAFLGAEEGDEDKAGFNDFEWTGFDDFGKAVSANDLIEVHTKGKVEKFDDVRADKRREGIFVCVMPIIMNRMEDWRGWPLMFAGFPWDREHKKFRESRAAVAEAVAMFVREAKASTGSRGIDSLKQKFGSSLQTSGTLNAQEKNPPAAPGSTLLSNDAVAIRQLSQKTDAGDAKVDGEALSWMTGLAGNVFPHWLGLGDAYRLATATAMEGPLLRNWSKYQRFWASELRQIVRFVLSMKTRYTGQEFDQYDADVSMDKLVELDLKTISDSMVPVMRDIFMPMFMEGLLPESAAIEIVVSTWRSILHALGISNLEQVLDHAEFDKLNLLTPEKRKEQQAEQQQQQFDQQKQLLSMKGGNGKEPDDAKPEELQALLTAAANRILG